MVSEDLSDDIRMSNAITRGSSSETPVTKSQDHQAVSDNARSIISGDPNGVDTTNMETLEHGHGSSLCGYLPTH
jgi:hypothetical protein